MPRKKLTRTQIREMNDLGPYQVINKPPEGKFRVSVNGEYLPGLPMSSTDAMYLAGVAAGLNKKNRVQVVRV